MFNFSDFLGYGFGEVIDGNIASIRSNNKKDDKNADSLAGALFLLGITGLASKAFPMPTFGFNVPNNCCGNNCGECEEECCEEECNECEEESCEEENDNIIKLLQEMNAKLDASNKEINFLKEKVSDLEKQQKKPKNNGDNKKNGNK